MDHEVGFNEMPANAEIDIKHTSAHGDVMLGLMKHIWVAWNPKKKRKPMKY